jgi:hypothetical protein
LIAIFLLEKEEEEGSLMYIEINMDYYKVSCCFYNLYLVLNVKRREKNVRI